MEVPSSRAKDNRLPPLQDIAHLGYLIGADGQQELWPFLSPEGILHVPAVLDVRTHLYDQPPLIYMKYTTESVDWMLEPELMKKGVNAWYRFVQHCIFAYREPSNSRPNAYSTPAALKSIINTESLPVKGARRQWHMLSEKLFALRSKIEVYPFLPEYLIKYSDWYFTNMNQAVFKHLGKATYIPQIPTYFKYLIDNSKYRPQSNNVGLEVAAMFEEYSRIVIPRSSTQGTSILGIEFIE